MAANETKLKKRKIAWGITGAGDRIAEFVQVMKEMKKQYEDIVEIQVFTSKAAEIVLKYYRVEKEVKQSFEKVTCEVNSNSPFLAPWMQTHKYEFLLIAPASSNTVAKIAYGIGDTLLTNAAIMGLKAFIPLYIVPSDFEEKIISSNLPNGKEIKLRIRKEDAANTRRLEKMENVTVLESPQKIRFVFEEWFNPKWTWQKNYRVWEANRKEFIYPENWVEPDLRNEKRELFDELDKKLLTRITSDVNLHIRSKREVESLSAIDGIGVSILFVGASVAGKAIAAETLAKELRLDLYRIDLSAVMSNYIGETEKNLGKVFEIAEHTEAILFFDEAEALFGKRTEVKNSHDRYANIELNFLLEQIESYRGLVIIASNRKKELDPSLLRRLKFIINFPIPKEE
ncbi:MAG TPA: archaeoflavoprotein AfpA [Nitrososphaerales archaeon]